MTKLQEVEEIIERLPLEHKVNLQVYIKMVREEEQDIKMCLLYGMMGYANALRVAGYINYKEYAKFVELDRDDFTEVP